MKYWGFKTGKAEQKIRVIGCDAPSVRRADAVYILPDLEVILYKNERELKDVFKSLHGDVVKETLWGFMEMPSVKGQPLRIHSRSVRSHRGKDSFYHTLGHELAHILEKMEMGKPAAGYVQGRYKVVLETGKQLLREIWYVTDIAIYGFKETAKAEIKKSATCLYKRMGRKAPKVCKELEQSVLRMRRKVNMLHRKGR
jgi:hypothetical protein